MKHFLMSTVLTSLMLVSSLAGAETDPRAADRAEMRAILADVAKALNEGDYALMKKHLHPQVVITYYNAEVTRTPAEMEAYFRRMTDGDDAVVVGFHTTANVSAPAIFHGDNTAIAWGTTRENYKLASGLEFDLNGLWTVTLRRDNGQWKIVALHFSSNLFDNPILDNARSFTWITGAVAFISGLIIAFVVMRVMRKKA
ncbi:MAG TPA: DUF4440 domain-containing protein [Gammaproteobacteria bacterium]|nr:DUF4440 domain-containing protein [Gammaproteobacteria bacterium]